MLNDREPTRQLGLTVFFCAVVVLAAVRFGSTPDRFAYQTFLLLLVPAAIALFGALRSADRRFLLLGLVGLVLLAHTALQPTTEAKGYLLASLAWAGLVVSLWLASDLRRARFMALALVTLGVFEAGYGIVQAVGGMDQIGSYYRSVGSIATGTFINRNHFAGLLNMVLGLSIGVLYAGLSRRRIQGRSQIFSWSWLVVLGCGVMALAMALSLSRAGALILIVLLVFAVVLLWWRRRSGSGGMPTRAAAILLGLTIALSLGYGADSLVGRFDELDAGDRPQVYRDTLRLIGDSPWLGVGPGMYRWHFRPYQTSEVTKLYTHAHNDYLQVAAEWGVPLALVFWSFVAWRFYRSVILFLGARQPWRAGIGLGCAAAVLSILLHSLLDFNLQIPANLLVFATVLGLGWAAEGSASKSPASEGSSRPTSSLSSRSRIARPTFVLLLGALAASGWIVGRRLAAEEIAHRQPDRTGLEAAIRRDASNPRFHLELGRLHRDPGHLDAAIRYTEEATRLSPYDWQAHWQLAQFHEVSGQWDQAEQSLLEAIELSPRDPIYQWRLANFFLRAGDEEKFWEPATNAMASDSSLLRPGFSLMTKMGAAGDRIDEAWPRGQAATLQLIDLLSRLDAKVIENRYLSLLQGRWKDLIANGAAPSLDEGNPLINGLFKARRFDDARREWIALARANSLDDSDFTEDRNLLWNGSFELPLAGTGLGWRHRAKDGVSVERAAAKGPDGSHALRVAFAGTHNPYYAGLEQRVAVRSGATYTLSFLASSSGLTSDRGPFLEISQAERRRIVHTSEEFLGDFAWREHSYRFTVPAESAVLLIRLVRAPSRGGEAIGGTLLLDAMVLTAWSAEDRTD